MSVPSCVTFRDQEVQMTIRRPCINNWSRVETYCHIVAAKKAMKECMDGFEEVIADGLAIAKELYRRGVLYKSSVDNCDPAQFADIPDFTLNKNSFFSSMFRSVDNCFRNWFVFLEVLRMYPECRASTDHLEGVYKKALEDLHVEKYRGEIIVAPPDEAKMLFDNIYDEFDSLWIEAKTLMDTLDMEKLKNNVRLAYMDENQKTDDVESREELYTMLRNRVDIMNTNGFDTMLMGTDQSSYFQDRVQMFVQFRALTSTRIGVRDFALQLENNPRHKAVRFSEEPSMAFYVGWKDDEAFFRYYFLMEVVFITLTRHQYFHHFDIKTKSIWFHLPDWMRFAMVKLTRERTKSLHNEGIVRVTVMSEMTVLDPSWNLTKKDQYDFMDSVIKITRGRVEEVDETLQGLRPLRRWESNDEDKRIESILDYIDEWPESVPVPPQTATISGFMSLYDTNHVWISHPFYTRRRGYKFCLIVYPRGTLDGHNTHLSIGTCLMRGENDDQLVYPVRGTFVVRLLNQMGDYGHIQHVIKYDNITRPEATQRLKDCNDFASVAVSVNQFAPLGLLDYNAERGTQYLANDSIFIQVMQADFKQSRR